MMLEQFARRWLAVAAMLAVVVAILTAGSDARADDPLAKPADAQAREHLTAGNRLYRVREFEKAIDAYKAGALKEDAPVFLYNLGQCYRQLGRYQDAIWQYQRFLDRAKPTGELKDAIDNFIKQMQSELEKKAMTQPPNEPAPSPDPDPKLTPPSPSTPTQITVVDHADPWYADGLGWGLAGTGTVAVGVAIGLFVNASGLEDDANRETQQDERQKLRDRAGDRRLIGTIVGITGVAALATGVIKLAINPSDRARTMSASASLTASGALVSISGSF